MANLSRVKATGAAAMVRCPDPPPFRPPKRATPAAISKVCAGPSGYNETAMPLPIIRHANPRDASAIARVYVDTWRDAYPTMIPDSVLVGMSHSRQREIWAQVLARHGAEIVMVAEDARAGIVGFGSCGRARAGTPAYQGEVYTLYVLADFRGSGIGKGLLHGLLGELSKRGYASALVWVLADNPARYFYAAMGGVMVAERDEALWGMTLHQAAYGWSDLPLDR